MPLNGTLTQLVMPLPVGLPLQATTHWNEKMILQMLALTGIDIGSLIPPLQDPTAVLPGKKNTNGPGAARLTLTVCEPVATEVRVASVVTPPMDVQLAES